ncbi:MAG: hypothetical protein JWR63_1339 [Conexibacter sp.]|nr:hypothetical protein [Conexibacter sp.]
MAGRPRSFDRDVALEQAKRLFWERGYDGASIADLTAAMGIAPPSLYAAFGDKRRLFEEASAAYFKDLDDGIDAALHAPTARDAVERVLRTAAEHHTSPDHPRGCLVMSEPLLLQRRATALAAVRRRLQQGLEAGELTRASDVEAITELVGVLLAGMSARARDGATRGQLEATVDLVLKAWPS